MPERKRFFSVDLFPNGDDVYKYDISAVHRAALRQFESWKRDLRLPRGRPAQVYNSRGGDRHDDQWSLNMLMFLVVMLIVLIMLIALVWSWFIEMISWWREKIDHEILFQVASEPCNTEQSYYRWWCSLVLLSSPSASSMKSQPSLSNLSNSSVSAALFLASPHYPENQPLSSKPISSP